MPGVPQKVNVWGRFDRIFDPYNDQADDGGFGHINAEAPRTKSARSRHPKPPRPHQMVIFLRRLITFDYA